MSKIKYLFIVFIICASCNNTTQKKVELPKIQFKDYVGKLTYGNIKTVELFPSNYVKPRRVDIWLPNNYSVDKKYAVLYMHDGQMLFDAETTWNKQEWKVDEIVGKLIEEDTIKPCIVVGIWNIPEIRHSDYYPKKPFDALPVKFKDSILKEGKKLYGSDFKTVQSGNYLEFIVKELKPFIDHNFSTLKNTENTFIAGSSMGGLISMYALCEYPEIFGGAACLSTHWIGFTPIENSPIPETFFSYMEQYLPSSSSHKIYFDYGTQTLDEFYLPYQHRVDEILKLKGYDNSNAKNLKFEGHNHSENSWNQRFQIPVQFLLNKK